MVNGSKQIQAMIGYAVVVFAVLLGVCWYFTPSTKGVPEDLIGEWHATDANYADRGLEIDSVSINFATGGGKVSVGIINQVKVKIEDGRMLYTISYTSDEAKNEVSFYYEHGKDQLIRFKNQEKTVWAKDQEKKTL